jgi:hypothetical protein
LFIPNYQLLAYETMRGRLKGDDGTEELSYINLGDMMSTSSLLFGTAFDSVNGAEAASAQEFVDDQIGPTPELPSRPAGPAFTGYMRAVSNLQGVSTDTSYAYAAPLTIYQRTRDPSSNQVTFFDVSNLYYGKRILPGSLTLTDTSLTGSGGAVKVTLKDDARGNIYRADSFTSASLWNSVGNVFYDEGIIVIKNPHLYFYGKDGFEIDFRGDQNIHVLKLEVLALQNQLNSSSNPNYQDVPPSGYATDTDPHFVYITGINFHDENLNVVAKTQLAQPIVKRHGDRVLFKVSIDV